MSLAWSQPYGVAHVMRFRASSHWASLCDRYEIKPDDWYPWWEKHGIDSKQRPLNFFRADSLPEIYPGEGAPGGRWCIPCSKAAVQWVRDLAALPAVAALLEGDRPCAHGD